MGRTEKSQGLAPPAVRKDTRAKQARQIINKSVPAVLVSNVRARRGADASVVIADPGPEVSGEEKKDNEGGEVYIKRKGQGRRKIKDDGILDEERGSKSEKKGRVERNGKKRNDSLEDDVSGPTLTSAQPTSPKRQRRIRIITTDSLTAAHILTFPSQYNDSDTKPSKKSPNTCVLNMASPLRPGGGVLSGATSQEEFLCCRTTLLPSLKESFYRLPEIGGIYTPDVLVFRNVLGLGDKSGELGPSERYFIDVISAGMLRFPELEGEEDEVKRLEKKDIELVEAKMRAVLRIATAKGAKKLVLGAWGCGAYGNPVADIARAWRKVFDGGRSTASGKTNKTSKDIEKWPDVEDVIFAIQNRKIAADFALAFDKNIEVEAGPDGPAEDDEEEEEDTVTSELRSKIQEMEAQSSKVWNEELRTRLGVIIDGLKAQLREREGRGEKGDTDDEEQGGDGSSADDSNEEDEDEENREVEVE